VIAACGSYGGELDAGTGNRCSHPRSISTCAKGVVDARSRGSAIAAVHCGCAASPGCDPDFDLVACASQADVPNLKWAPQAILQEGNKVDCLWRFDEDMDGSLPECVVHGS
jgi:hypothetical protein